MAPAESPSSAPPGFGPQGPGGLALVLTGGGARAAYQVGVLSALAERAPDLEIPILTGVSAGAINAAFLGARSGSLSEGIQELKGYWKSLTANLIYGSRAPTLVRSIARWLEELALGRHEDPLKARGFFDTRPLRAFLSQAVSFGRIQTNLEEKRLRALALTATSYETGLTVTFVQGTPDLPMWRRSRRIGVASTLEVDHLMASSAIPLVFPAVRLADGYYGDGSVRQTFPLSPAIHLGARRILAIGTRPNLQRASGEPGGYPSVAQSFGLLLDSLFMDHLDADAEVLESINRLRVRSIADAPEDSFRTVDFLLLRPSRDLGEIAQECGEGLPRALRSLAKAIGSHGRGGSEFLSYLLFEPHYTQRLIELGHADGNRLWDRVGPLVTPAEPVGSSWGPGPIAPD